MSFPSRSVVFVSPLTEASLNLPSTSVQAFVSVSFVVCLVRFLVERDFDTPSYFLVLMFFAAFKAIVVVASVVPISLLSRLYSLEVTTLLTGFVASTS